MRFMMLVKANQDSEAGVMPNTGLVAEMGELNEAMAKAGVLLAGEGLHPSSKGVRVTYTGRKRLVTDGPFAETKELLAGFWMIQVASRAEALEWASRGHLAARGRRARGGAARGAREEGEAVAVSYGGGKARRPPRRPGETGGRPSPGARSGCAAGAATTAGARTRG
jgi:hypothetical protein